MNSQRYAVAWSELASLDTLCAGIVTCDGIEDACCKPATAVVYDIESAQPWPACTWHAHRYGGAITLAEIRQAATTGCVWLTREVD